MDDSSSDRAVSLGELASSPGARAAARPKAEAPPPPTQDRRRGKKGKTLRRADAKGPEPPAQFRPMLRGGTRSAPLRERDRAASHLRPTGPLPVGGAIPEAPSPSSYLSHPPPQPQTDDGRPVEKAAKNPLVGDLPHRREKSEPAYDCILPPMDIERPGAAAGQPGQEGQSGAVYRYDVVVNS